MANSDPVLSVVKALDILQYLAEHPEGARLNEIVEAFELKRPTAHNLVRTLRLRGFVDQDPTRKLRLGPAIAELAASQRRGGILTAAESELTALAAEYPGMTLSFCELAGTEIFCRLRMSPDRPGVVQHPINFTFPFYTTVTGLCFQSFGELVQAELERKYPFAEFGMGTWGERAKFEAALTAYRQKGYVSHLRNIPGFCAAFPVGGRFTLGCRGPSPASETALTQQLLESAARLSL